MRLARLVLTLMLLTNAVFAIEVAELRNGFSIPHRTRVFSGNFVRLYLDDQKKSFIDVAADDVERYSTEPDPVVPPQVAKAADQAKPARSTGEIVSDASAKQGIDSDFIHSVIRHESAGNANAVSPAGARGLMQLMPGTASQLGVSDSFNPEENVSGGTRYLKELLERYNGDAIKALAAYNAGPQAVDRYKGVPPYRETQQYVRRIVNDYNKSKQPKPKPAEKPKTTASGKAPTTIAKSATEVAAR